MNARIYPLFDETRLLAPEERSQLALALLDNMESDTADETSVEQAWIAQAHHRLESLAQGSLRMVPWKQAKARIAAA